MSAPQEQRSTVRPGGRGAHRFEAQSADSLDSRAPEGVEGQPPLRQFPLLLGAVILSGPPSDLR
jgi:hypothetical protein